MKKFALTVALAIGVAGCKEPSSGTKMVSDGKADLAAEQVRLIKSKVLLVMQAEDGCPSIFGLGLARRDVTDPWGSLYSVECDGPSGALVRSLGPDAQPRTGDDITSSK